MERIKLIVINENALGYIFPEQPNSIHLLSTSILKGCSWNEWSTYPTKGNKIRLASEKDFDEYRVSFNGYKNNPNEYEFSTK